MSFQINTNTYALNTLSIQNGTNREISSSLEKLSSGLAINSAADDASGLLIANNLRMQASSLNQATSNAKSAVNLVQIADNALEEVDKILTTIKTKAIQAAEDGQTSDTRLAIQKDVNRLIESLNNISNTTKYNGQNLLSGAFSNKEFQIGAYSNETVKMSIANTDSNHIGHMKMETIDLNSFTSSVTSSGAATATLTAGSSGTYAADANNNTIGFTTTEVLNGTTVSMAKGDTLTYNPTDNADTLTIRTKNEDSKNMLMALVSNTTGEISYNSATDTFTIDDAAGAAAAIDIESTIDDFSFEIVSFNDDATTAGVGTLTITDSDITDGGIKFEAGSGNITLTESGGDIATVSNEFTLGETVELTIDGNQLQTVEINNTAGTGVGALADLINANSNILGSTASFNVSMNGSAAVAAGNIENLVINGKSIGNIDGVVANDADGKLVNAINSVSYITGVTANVNSAGILELTSDDGRAIKIEATNTNDVMNLGAGSSLTNVGSITLNSIGAEDIDVEMKIDGTTVAASEITTATTDEINNLASILTEKMLTTRDGAQKAMDIADAALSVIDAIRSDIGSVQQQLDSTINNITITAANVSIAEGGIRDVDFAVESANFNKYKLLAQSGTYALSQANEVQQNVTTLLR